MSAKNAMRNRFKDILVKVPEDMRPTQESIERMGKEISAQIRENDVMRHMSMINASKRIVR